MIPFKNRFHGHSSLKYVYKNGKSARCHIVTIKYIINPHRKESRIAVIVGRKIIKSAVRRNLIRRRLYECVRVKIPDLQTVYDIAIIVTSSDLLNLNHQELSDQINQLFGQSRLI